MQSVVVFVVETDGGVVLGCSLARRKRRGGPTCPSKEAEAAVAGPQLLVVGFDDSGLYSTRHPHRSRPLPRRFL